MFRFENPQYLYLLLLFIPLIIAHYLVRYMKTRKMGAYGDWPLIKKMFVGQSLWRDETKFWLGILALSCFITALARPQYGIKTETKKRAGIEAIVALDVSNSMLAQDVKPSRLEKAKLLISSMFDQMEDDKVGLIVFAGQAFTQLPITTDYISADMFLESVSTDMVSVQGTDIGAAIDLAMKSFTAAENSTKAIFIITDGEDNEQRGLAAAREAAKRGMKVYVLGIGDPQGSPIPINGNRDYIRDSDGNIVMSKLDEQACQAIASEGNGAYLYVDNSSSAMRALREQLNSLSKQQLEIQSFSEYDEQFQDFIILGLFFLLVDAMLVLKTSSKKNLFTFLNLRQNEN